MGATSLRRGSRVSGTTHFHTLSGWASQGGTLRPRLAWPSCRRSTRACRPSERAGCFEELSIIDVRLREGTWTFQEGPFRCPDLWRSGCQQVGGTRESKREQVTISAASLIAPTYHHLPPTHGVSSNAMAPQ